MAADWTHRFRNSPLRPLFVCVSLCVSDSCWCWWGGWRWCRDTTGIPWCGFQGSGSNLFQEMQPVTRAPWSQTMMLPICACGGRDGVRAWRLCSCIVCMLFLFYLRDSAVIEGASIRILNMSGINNNFMGNIMVWWIENKCTKKNNILCILRAANDYLYY